MYTHVLSLMHLLPMAMGKTGRGVGTGNQWVKPQDWELGDHVTEH